MIKGNWWHWKLNKELLAIKDWDKFLGTKDVFKDEMSQEEMKKRIVQCDIACNILSLIPTSEEACISGGKNGK